MTVGRLSSRVVVVRKIGETGATPRREEVMDHPTHFVTVAFVCQARGGRPGLCVCSAAEHAPLALVQGSHFVSLLP